MSEQQRNIKAVGRVEGGRVVVPAWPGVDYDADLFPPSFREIKRAQSNSTNETLKDELAKFRGED
jgi:hypothetical protein